MSKITRWFYIWRRLHCMADIRGDVADRDLDSGYCIDRYSIEDHHA